MPSVHNDAGPFWGKCRLSEARDLISVQVSSDSTLPSPLESQEATATETQSREGEEEGCHRSQGRERSGAARGCPKFAHAGAQRSLWANTRARWPLRAAWRRMLSPQSCSRCPVPASETGAAVRQLPDLAGSEMEQRSLTQLRSSCSSSP